MDTEVYEKVKTIHSYNLGKVTLCRHSEGDMIFLIENDMADEHGFDSVIVEDSSLNGTCVFPEFRHDDIGCDFCESHDRKTIYCVLLTNYIHETDELLQPRSISYTRSICTSCAHNFSRKLKKAIDKHFSEELVVGSL